MLAAVALIRAFRLALRLAPWLFPRPVLATVLAAVRERLSFTSRSA